MSNVVPVMAPAAPKSPKLRLEGLHPDGIDVTWQTPQQSGDAHISVSGLCVFERVCLSGLVYVCVKLDERVYVSVCLSVCGGVGCVWVCVCVCVQEDWCMYVLNWMSVCVFEWIGM